MTHHWTVPSTGSAEAILDALDPDQQAVARAVVGPVVVLAGAGTGKTRAITHRIAYGVRTGVYQPQSVLALTYTKRAAGEMRARLRTLGVAAVQARTFHAAAWSQLRYFWPMAIGGPPPSQLLTVKAPLLFEAARRLGVEADKTAIRDIAAEIEWMKVCMIAPDDYPARAVSIEREAPAGYDHRTLARLASAYEDTKTERAVIDFEDVLAIMAGIMTEHRAVAEKVRTQYRRFVVDEYQDVNPLQQYLLDQWLGGRDELCVVGDPSQTIYSYSGASPQYLLNFRRTYPRAQEVRLERDYRSTPQVVQLANEVLRRGRVVGALDLHSQRDSGPPVRYVNYPNDDAEAEGIARRAAQLIASGTRAAEIAVLTRTNTQLRVFEEALARHNIGFVVRGGEEFFRRSEVIQAIAFLRAAARSADPNVAMPRHVRDVLGSCGWTDKPPAAQGSVRERWDAMQALVDHADAFVEATSPGDPVPTLVTFVEDLAHRADAQHAPTVDGVTLATLHAAKGLEWDAVFLAGMSEGFLPHLLSTTADQRAEERRLLYVGVTRARTHLELSYSNARSGGQRSPRKRSRFLDGLWPEASEARGPQSRPGALGRRGGVRQSQGNVNVHTPVNEALADSLRTWRRNTAQQHGVRAFRIMSDTTLVGIASIQPQSLEALGQISGIGPQKLATFGNEILDLVQRAGVS
ncbi:MAG: ATP-dependent DNA helicase UvrD2 [Cellulomonadaceae bacterium]|jgi:DNA helicase-2/ATP-dependent DNA helicase PcrA|nr:ATP-dependent DNA helicase UvrD2 [Cellulomonadaceae bacterium]